MKTKYFFILCLFWGNFSLAQSYYTLNGQVVDTNTKKFLPFAHVFLPESGIGTVANEYGYFSLHLSEVHLTNKVHISHLGYQIKIFEARKAINENTKTFNLEPDPNLIETVEVLSTPEPLVYYVKQVVKSLNKNYPSKLHFVSGFLREIKVNSQTLQYDRLMEAAIDMEDRSIKSPIANIKVRVNELRKSHDYSDYSNLQYRLAERTRKGSNRVYQLFERNPIRRHFTVRGELSTKYALFNLMQNNPEHLKLDGITYLDNQKIYIISFNKFPFNSTLYIDAQDFGIHKLNYKITLSKYYENLAPNPDHEVIYIDEEKNVENITYEYEKVNGKYQLVLITEVASEGFLNSNIPGQKGGWSYAYRTFSINDFYTDKKQFKRIRFKEIMDRKVKLYELELPYRPEFWQHYNILKMKPLDSLTQSNLESVQSLEAQFKANGNGRR